MHGPCAKAATRRCERRQFAESSLGWVAGPVAVIVGDVGDLDEALDREPET